VDVIVLLFVDHSSRPGRSQCAHCWQTRRQDRRLRSNASHAGLRRILQAEQRCESLSILFIQCLTSHHIVCRSS